MNRFSKTIKVSDCTLIVTFDYFPGDESLMYSDDGDPGFPATSAEIEVDEIELTEGKLVDLLYEISNTEDWWLKLEEQLIESEE